LKCATSKKLKFKSCKKIIRVFDYAVVDCFTNFVLQTKYDVSFIPTVIVKDKNNKEKERYIRSNNLYYGIKSLLNEKRK